MPIWKDLLLAGYYVATRQARQREAAVRAVELREPVRVAFYHRVANRFPNRWTIHSQSFAAHIDWARKQFEFVTLAEAQQRIASGRNRVPTACITFDDGYAENFHTAIPLLLEHGIPFTYFVSTDHVLRGQPFPHDLAAGRPLAVNTIHDLRELAAAGIEIGAHTRSHADLGAARTYKQLTREIVGSKHDLEDAIGQPVRYFAFPYGLHANLSRAAFRVAYEVGFAGVCSAYGGYNFPGDDPFHIRRFHADEQFSRFANYMTVDPRKVRSHNDFDPGPYRVISNVAIPNGAEDLANLDTSTLVAPIGD